MASAVQHVQADHPGPHRLRGGQVLVADTVRKTDGTVFECTTGSLLAGELRRRGLDVVRGPLTIGSGRLSASVGVPAAMGTSLVCATAADDSTQRVVDEVLQSWMASTGPRTVFLASPRGFCAGVDRAVKIVERALERGSGTVYVRREIVHNKHVVDDLRHRGVVFVQELDEVPDGATVVFSAHGVSPAVREEGQRRGLDVIDGTCPLVSKVHAQARRQSGRGDTIVLIGHHDHEEVEGVLGEAPNSIVVIDSVEEVEALSVKPGESISYLTQTTLAIDDTAEVVSALRTKIPDLKDPDSEGICYATTNRQNAVSVVAERADVMFVVGSPNSSNSVRLVELSEKRGTPAHLIDDVSDIRPEWVRGVWNIGLTGGASAPTNFIDDVVAALRGLGEVEIVLCETTVETVEFSLPAAVRSLPQAALQRGEPNDRP